MTISIPVADIRCRVFEKRTTTAEQEAAPYSYHELVSLLKSTRRELRLAVTELADSAFEARPDDADGNEVWSAGQIVSHLIEAALRFDFYGSVRKLAGADMCEPPDGFQKLRGEKALSRAETLFALDLADQELERLQADIPNDVDFSTITAAPPFGELSIRGWFLLTSLHEGLHVNQLEEFAAES